MNNKKSMLFAFLISIGTIAFHSVAFSDHGNSRLLEDLAKKSKEVADAVEKAAADTARAVSEASDSVVHDLGAERRGQWRFNMAVKDAEKFGAEKISDKLTAVIPSNTKLTWNANKDRVLVVSWMSEWAAKNFYEPSLGKEFTVSRDMWVTISPEVKNFAKNYKERKPLHYRLQQLMGLPIALTNNYFVESWVKPEDLVRPCIDPEITDTKCDYDGAPQKTPDAAYLAWYQKEKSEKYAGPWSFPWTRLGYTYDLSKIEGNDKFGISEYVIRPGAKILIHKIVPTNQFKDLTEP